MKKVVLSLILFVVSQLVGSIIGSAIIIVPQLFVESRVEVSNIIGLYYDNMGLITILSLIISQVLLIIVLLTTKFFKISDLVAKTPIKIFVVIILFILVSLFTIDLVSSLLDLPDNNEWLFKEMSNSLLIIIPIVLLGPIVEEIVFRKIIIQEFLNMSLKPHISILFSALIFGLIHINPAQMLFAFAAGLIFGWIYFKTGSIVPGIIGHIINNSIGVIELRSAKSFNIINQADQFFSNPLLLVTFMGSILLAILLANYIIKYYK
ncbi:MAG TPA: type II CAAX endopeptidase family protein [Bacteroidaceae bacterium]|nr:type II CAAX endopeptidase family protein [Bacteroidaceae bacterium]